MVLTKAVHLNDAAPINYAIKKTGYYCVLTDVVNTKKYDLVVEYRNAYGELEATQIPKLPFYGGMSILYALLAAYWGFLYYQHRHDICKQKPRIRFNQLHADFTQWLCKTTSRPSSFSWWWKCS